MSEGGLAPGMNSGRWREVDAGDTAYHLEYLDVVAARLREDRRQVTDALAVEPGCSVLDVGSGAGEFLIELVASVSQVHAVGVDASESLVATARARAEAAGAAVRFEVGDAEHLEFVDGSFDRVNCSRVLLHVDDARGAVAEMARVLVPGGRVAIFEPDFDGLMIDSDDLATATAVRSALTAVVRNPDIGRRLRRLVLDAGLELIDVRGRANQQPNLQIAINQFNLFDHLDTAVRIGTVTAKAAEDWRTWIEAKPDRFTMSAVAFTCIARKPG